MHKVGYLRGFGCLLYAHVEEMLRKKLEPRSISCVFVEYSKESKTYCSYDPKIKKVIKSCDVIFDEGFVFGQPCKKLTSVIDTVETLGQMTSVTPPLQSTSSSSSSCSSDISSLCDDDKSATNEA